MKLLVLKICIITLSISCIANAQTNQTDQENIVGTHFALGTGDYGAPNYDGTGSYNVKYYYSIGLDYSRVLSKTWDFCSGIEYTYSHLMVTPAFTGKPVGKPHKENLKLTTIPVQLKYHIRKIIYLNGGLFLNIDSRTSEDWSVSSRNGTYKSTNHVGMLIGCGIGIGFEYELFGSGIMLSLNPNLRWNGIGGIGSFHSAQVDGFRFLQSGVSFGIGYKF